MGKIAFSCKFMEIVDIIIFAVRIDLVVFYDESPFFSLL